MQATPMSQRDLLKLVGSRLVLAVPVLMLLLFLPAGTLAYWQAWLYLAILFVPMTFVLLYLLRNDPELLERRMRTRERERTQSRLMWVALVYFLVIFVLPGLDKRFGWSQVSVAVVLLADLLVLLGYGIVFLVFRENRYASRVIEVAQNQQVIDTGPYAVVRHPMYAGTLLMYLLSPLALGSAWAMLPALLIIPILVVRIRNEETVLARDLPGYRAYMERTRYRVVPGVW